jgi:hypothetical protein
MNHVEPDHEELRARAARILKAMDDTPIPAMDATFYAHYAEELRMLVEEFTVAAADNPATNHDADRRPR